MSRLMSVSHTADAVVARRKTVTRRVGWRFLKPGDRLTLCRKVMGRGRCTGCGGDGWVSGSGMDCCGDTRNGECRGYCVVQVQTQEACDVCGGRGVEPLERLAEVEVVSVRREPIIAMRDQDVPLEGIEPNDPRFDEWYEDGMATAVSFASWWLETFAPRGFNPYNDDVTRIEWRYL